MEPIKVLDHGYVRFVEAWGHGDAGNGTRPDASPGPDGPDDNECGIIEAARQSTQASFRGWEDKPCQDCTKEPCRGCRGTGRWDHADFFDLSSEERQGKDYTTTCPICLGDKRGKTNCTTCEGTRVIKGDQRLLAYLFNGNPQHATPFEFSGMVIEVRAPIFVFREWHRHRVFSFNEMSARYAPLPDFNYVPTVERCLLNQWTKNKQAGKVVGSEVLDERTALEFRHQLIEQYKQAEALYQTALLGGVPKELARCCLPVGRYSQMRASANLRNWLGFITLRADPAAQWEIQQYAHAVGTILAVQFPRTWALFDAARKKVGG